MLSLFEFPEDLLKRIREVMDHQESQYTRLEHVSCGACILLNDCQHKHILRELEKLVQQPKAAVLEEENATLKIHIADLANEVAAESEEMRRLNNESKEGLDSIRSNIGHPGDVFNKARLSDKELKMDDHILTPKVVAILVEFNRRMELTVAEMRRLLPAPTLELN